MKIAAITSQSHHQQLDQQRDFERDAPKLVLSVPFRCCEQPAVDIDNVFEGILNLKGESGGFVT